MKKINKALAADLSMVAIAMIWGSSFVVVKDSLKLLSPYWMIAARFTVASILSLVFFGRKLKGVGRRDVFSGLITGVVIYVAFVFQTIGAVYTTASKNALITATYVVMVPFLHWIFRRKRPRPVHIIAAVLCFSGVAMLTLNNGFSRVNFGDVMTMVGGIMFALHFVLLDAFSKKCNPLALTITQLTGCAAAGVAVALVLDLDGIVTVWATPGTLFSVIYLSVFATFLAYMVQTTAQKYTAASHASLILSLEAVFGCIFSVMYFHDVFTPVMIAGCVFSFGSVILSESADFIKKS